MPVDLSLNTDVKKTNSYHEFEIMNFYIESIEGGTYLAGIGESSAETFLKDKHNDSMQFQCIITIKQQVAVQKFDKIWLKQNTPYDEMCGLQGENEPLFIELDWR